MVGSPDETNSSPPGPKQQTDDEAKNESSHDGPEEVEIQEDWIQGIPLIMVTAGLTLVTLLFMLDVSIVSTVNEM